MRPRSRIAGLLFGTWRKSVLSAVVVVAIAIAVIAWERTRPDMPPTIQVTGRVVTSAYFSLAGTMVQLSVPDYDQDETTHTDQHGRFEQSHVHRGHIELRFHRSGYRDERVEVANRVMPLNEDLGLVVLTAGGPAIGPAFPIAPGGPKLPIQTTICEVHLNPQVFDGKMVAIHAEVYTGSTFESTLPFLRDKRCPPGIALARDVQPPMSKANGNRARLLVMEWMMGWIEADLTGAFANEPKRRIYLDRTSGTLELHSISNVTKGR
jgi:hypothetical protein